MQSEDETLDQNSKDEYDTIDNDFLPALNIQEGNKTGMPKGTKFDTSGNVMNQTWSHAMGNTGSPSVELPLT